MSSLGDTLVLGLGRSGVASARYLASLVERGEALSVSAIDAAETPELEAVAEELRALGVRVTLGSEEVEGGYDLCIASPGIPPHARLMLAAQAASTHVISELEFAYQRSAQTWVAITGTNGKTTTTALVLHLLRTAGIPARAAGNIGAAAIAEVADANENEVLVAEVSSFQLALTERFRPRVAVLLNITPDHTDWHGSMERYTADKARVFENMTAEDVAVIDVDDEGSAPFAESVAARGVPVTRVSLTEEHAGDATVIGDALKLETRGGPIRLVRIDELQIKGAHNVSNALAAAAAAHSLGVTASAIREGLRSFAPIEHRLEPVAIVDEVEWFNDSKATNPDAVMKALTAFGDRPLVVLLGGRNKHNDFGPLAKKVAGRAKAAVLFGEARQELEAAFEGQPVRTVSAVALVDAVEVARALSEPGDAVVLSPACASFDEFTSYEHRGRVFKELVAAMAGEGS